MGFVDTLGQCHQSTLCDVTFQLQTQHIEVTLAVVEAVQCTLMHFGHNHYSLHEK